MKAQLTYSSPSSLKLSPSAQAIAGALFKAGLALALAVVLGMATGHISLTQSAWSPVQGPVGFSVFTA